MTAILLVEDDNNLSQTLKGWLEHEDFSVDVVADGSEAAALLANRQHDLVILDWELPGQSGVELLKTFRGSGGETPILMLTGKDTIADREAGLNSGADDYLTKPFSLKELSARIRALLRRPRAYVGDVLRVGNLLLEPRGLMVKRGAEEIHLSQQEFNLLHFFMRHPDQFFTPEDLLDRVWKSTSEVSPAVVRNYVMMLRKKIDVEGAASWIESVRGLGYKLNSKLPNKLDNSN